jgi:3'(2'), 5'-bisphosphate nucleotidase
MLIQTSEIDFAIHAVREASLLVQRVQREIEISALTKGDKSPVTVADFAAQAVVARLLSEHLPDIPLVAEESSAELQTPENAPLLEEVVSYVRTIFPDADAEKVCAWIDLGAAAPAEKFWTLDPIDGTKGFLRGDQYAVALALVESGKVNIGALGCPNLREGITPDKTGTGSLLLAARGEGTWRNTLADFSPDAWSRVRVSPQDSPSNARLLRSFESGHTNASEIEAIAARLGIKAAPVRMDSQAKYAVLACGGGEILLRLLSPKQPNYREKIWDQAAGSILVEEAGGRVTDIFGAPLDFSTGRMLTKNRGVVATNGILHESVLAALREENK